MGLSTVLILVLVVLGFILFFFVFSALSLWIQALISGAHVGLLNIVFMRFRKVSPQTDRRGENHGGQGGPGHFHHSCNRMIWRGNVQRVVQALIAADKANIALDFKRAAAIDLAGRHVLEAVQMSVNPKVIDTPRVAGVAKDGIQLTAISRVTVRANIDRLVGGAGEETILARVGEGIVTTIGSAITHKLVLEKPDMISKTVLEKGLDAGTAFEILSIDIADVDVGKNIGAVCWKPTARKPTKIAQAKAEERRAMAIAAEQEMKAKTQEMRAKVVEAEAQIPLAMSEAFKKGNLGVMDYYKMKNIMADTSMRDSISGASGKGQEGEHK